MKKYLLPESGSFFKTNLHVHTTVSDGRMTPEEVKKVYKENGYSAVAFTDHQIMLPHPELCDDEFIAITATEVAKNSGHYMFLPSTHFNVYARDPMACTYPYYSPNAIWDAIAHVRDYYNDEMRNFNYGETFGYGPTELNKVIKACNESGYLVCYNHPNGSLENYSYYGGLEGIWGAECFNTGCAGGFGYDEDIHVIDDINRKGERRAFPIAADDAHSLGTCCKGYVMVKAEALTYANLFDALEKGDFYASTGVHITELYIEDSILHVELDGAGADEIMLYTPIRFRRKVKSEGTAPLTHAAFDISPLLEMCSKVDSELTKNLYIRLNLKRNDGAEAHTKAFFLDEI